MSKRIRLVRGDGRPVQQGTMPAATGHWWSGIEHPSERQHALNMQMYAAEEARVIAANGGRLPSFATGGNVYEQGVPDPAGVRRIDDPPDEHHSPEQVPSQPRLGPLPVAEFSERPELPTVGTADPYPPAEQRVTIAGD
jgi:hypothetical protein